MEGGREEEREEGREGGREGGFEKKCEDFIEVLVCSSVLLFLVAIVTV